MRLPKTTKLIQISVFFLTILLYWTKATLTTDNVVLSTTDPDTLPDSLTDMNLDTFIQTKCTTVGPNWARIMLAAGAKVEAVLVLN